MRKGLKIPLSVLLNWLQSGLILMDLLLKDINYTKCKAHLDCSAIQRPRSNSCEGHKGYPWKLTKQIFSLLKIIKTKKIIQIICIFLFCIFSSSLWAFTSMSHSYTHASNFTCYFSFNIHNISPCFYIFFLNILFHKYISHRFRYLALFYYSSIWIF